MDGGGGREKQWLLSCTGSCTTQYRTQLIRGRKLIGGLPYFMTALCLQAKVKKPSMYTEANVAERLQTYGLADNIHYTIGELKLPSEWWGQGRHDEDWTPDSSKDEGSSAAPAASLLSGMLHCWISEGASAALALHGAAWPPRDHAARLRLAMRRGAWNRLSWPCKLGFTVAAAGAAAVAWLHLDRGGNGGWFWP